MSGKLRPIHTVLFQVTAGAAQWPEPPGDSKGTSCCPDLLVSIWAAPSPAPLSSSLSLPFLTTAQGTRSVITIKWRNVSRRLTRFNTRFPTSGTPLASSGTVCGTRALTVRWALLQPSPASHPNPGLPGQHHVTTIRLQFLPPQDTHTHDCILSNPRLKSTCPPLRRFSVQAQGQSEHSEPASLGFEKREPSFPVLWTGNDAQV